MLAERCNEKHASNPSYATPARLILVSDLILPTSIEKMDKKDVHILVDSIKVGIKDFLTREFGWTRPQGGILNGPFRTKQIVLPPAIIMRLDPTELEAELHNITTRTECRIRITDAYFQHQLVSITGQKQALPLAELLLKQRFT